LSKIDPHMMTRVQAIRRLRHSISSRSLLCPRWSCSLSRWYFCSGSSDTPSQLEAPSATKTSIHATQSRQHIIPDLYW